MDNISSLILQKRMKIGLDKKDFAKILGIKKNHEQIITDWESNIKKPSKAMLTKILKLNDSCPFKQNKLENMKFSFIDLFAGIGGIRLPFQELGGKCVFSSEWDHFAQKTYAINFGDFPKGDITKIKSEEIPEHDILLGGFPCQAFSQAGFKKGFNDTRGTMFFEIQRILVNKRPKAFLLENVKQLISHNNGNTFKVILNILEGKNDSNIPNNLPLSDEVKKALSCKLNYQVFYKIISAKDFGVPQKRERIYIVGFDKDYFNNINIDELFSWAQPLPIKTRLGDILQCPEEIDDKYTLSDKLWTWHQKRKNKHIEKGNGFGYSLFNADSEYTNTLLARYYKDGNEILIEQSELGKRPRKLTPRECARLQGFPENYIIDAVSDCQIYKELGNSVTVPVIHSIAKQIIKVLDLASELINNR